MNENLNPHASKQIYFSLKLAAVMIGSALLLSLARKQGWIDPALVVRGSNIILGLALAVYGNAMPKMMDGTPPRSLREATLRQSVVRVGGWAMTLAFLTWAGLWAFAPRQFALTGSLLAVGACAAIMAGYALWKYVACHLSRTG